MVNELLTRKAQPPVVLHLVKIMVIECLLCENEKG